MLKLYRCLRKTEKTQPRQLVFYDPGVGTLARPDPWHKLKQDFNAILGLATGYGLDDNVLAAYAFLVDNYRGRRPDLSVRLFPRRLYRARAGGADPQGGADLAAAGQSRRQRADRLQAVFQRRRAEISAAESAALTDAGDEDGPLAATPFDNAAQFARITSTRWPTIRFVGVWDTVASVIVPRADRLYWPSLEELAFTLQNPSVQIFRQAISIDERRCMFRLKKWDEPQTFTHNRFNDAHAEPQDIKQVWFAGVHADIGGGYPEMESGLSKYPLIWMIDEAVKCGLAVNPRTVNQLAWGVQRKGSPFSYVAPDVRGESARFAARARGGSSNSCRRARSTRSGRRGRSHFGFYIPDAEPRLIPEGAFIHESVVKRMDMRWPLSPGQSAGAVSRRCRCRCRRSIGTCARRRCEGYRRRPSMRYPYSRFGRSLRVDAQKALSN